MDNNERKNNEINVEETSYTECRAGEGDGVLKTDARDYFSRLFFAVLILSAVNFGIQISVSYIFYYNFPAIYNSWQFSWIVSVIPLYCIALPLFILTLPKLRYTYQAPHKVKTPTLLLFLLISMACMTLFNYVSAYSVEMIRTLSNDMLFKQDALNEMISETPIWVTALVVCIIAPIGEEFIFRKLIVDRTQAFGELSACIISGIIFGLFHGNLRQAIYAAPLGMVLAYVYIKTRNLIYPILMHMTVNLFGSVVVPNLALYALDGIDALEKGPITPELISENILSLLIYLGIFGIGGAILIGGIVAFIVLLCKKKIRFSKQTILKDTNFKLIPYVLSSPGAIVMLVFFGFLILRAATR